MATPPSKSIKTWTTKPEERSLALTVRLGEDKRFAVPYMHLVHMNRRPDGVLLTFSCAEILLKATGDFPLDKLFEELADQKVCELAHLPQAGLSITAHMIVEGEKVAV
jgi:hypothetical protein